MTQYGAVYEVTDSAGAVYAIKYFKSELFGVTEAERSKQTNEIQLLKELNHSNIVRLIEVDEHGGLVFEYYPSDLSDEVYSEKDKFDSIRTNEVLSQ